MSYFAQKLDHFCHWGEDTAYVAFLQGGSLLLLSCRNGFWFNILTYWDIFHEFIQYIKSILVMIFLRWQQCHLIALEKHGDLADLQIQVATWINIRIVLGNSFKATQTSLDDGENNTTFKSKNIHSNLQLFNVYLKN